MDPADQLPGAREKAQRRFRESPLSDRNSSHGRLAFFPRSAKILPAAAAHLIPLPLSLSLSLCLSLSLLAFLHRRRLRKQVRIRHVSPFETLG